MNIGGDSCGRLMSYIWSAGSLRDGHSDYVFN